LNLINRVQNITHRHAHADPDNIRHTLILLGEKPVERLRRALLRARRIEFGNNEMAFLKDLNNEKIEFMIVGLSAAALQGTPVVADNISLWFKDLTDIGIQKALKKVGGTFMFPVSQNPPMFVGEAVKLFDIVTHMHGLESFAEEKQCAIKVPIGRLKVPVLALERIIRNKEATDREKDRLVLPVLRDALIAITESRKQDQ